MALTDPSGTPVDRRRHPRAATQRHVLFSGSHERALISPGQTVDISLTGIQVRCHTPEPVGAAIDVELHAKSSEDGSDPILVRGRVAYIRPISAHEYAMGIRLEAPVLSTRTTSPTPIPTNREAQELLKTIQNSLKEINIATKSPIAFLDIRHEPDNTVAAEPPAAGTRKHARRALALLAAAFLVSLALWLIRPETQAIVRTIGEGDGPYVAHTLNARRPLPPQTGGTVPQDNEGSAPGAPEDAKPEIGTVPSMLGAALEHLERGDAERALDRFAEVSAYPTGSAVERFLGHFGQAQALAMLDRTEEAAAALDRISDGEPELPEPWRDAAVEMQRAIAAHDATTVAALRFRDALQLESLPDDAARAQFRDFPARDLLPENVAASSRGLWLHISKRDYVLTVYRDGEPLRRFPVGLGHNDATPGGAFYIANRITNPDWFDRGRVVKAGNPENPLGSRWMGLGNDSGPTSYGIHPTNEPESIRANRSRGCIRMRPTDAEALFDLCPVGTPVFISNP